jgi:hypothetical protein
MGVFLGFAIGYVLIFGIGTWCAWGGLSAAIRAFSKKEVRVVGNTFIRGRWAIALGIVFLLFGLAFALAMLLIASSLLSEH